MAYKTSIANEIWEIYESAPTGKTSEYYLDYFDQQDVADTVNILALDYPKIFQDTFVGYENKAIIAIMK